MRSAWATVTTINIDLNFIRYINCTTFITSSVATNCRQAVDKEDDKDEAKSKDEDSKDDDSDDEQEEHEVVSGNLEDDLEKPSFLRRLGRRRKEESDHKDDDSDPEDK